MNAVLEFLDLHHEAIGSLMSGTLSLAISAALAVWIAREVMTLIRRAVAAEVDFRMSSDRYELQDEPEPEARPFPNWRQAS